MKKTSLSKIAEKAKQTPVGKCWRNILPTWVFAFVIFMANVLLVSWAQKNTETVEMIYSRKIYPVMVSVLSRITGVFPVSVAEWGLYLIVIIGAVYVLIQLILVVAKPCGLYRLVRVLSVGAALAACAGALFYTLWGFNFSRHSLAQNLGWHTEPTDTATLQSLCEHLIVKANEAAEDTLRDKNNRCVLSTDLSETLDAVAASWEELAEQYAFMGKGRYGRPKPIMFSLGMSYQQITGIFVPYTYEANVNTMTTSALLPSTAAHECAHQRGFAREDEANFLGYLACKASDRSDLVYSGYLLATIHSINALANADIETYWDVFELFSDKVRADLLWNNEFWNQFEGPIAEVASKRNDRYLKNNGQESGVKSYGRMVDLLIAKYRLAYEQ